MIIQERLAALQGFTLSRSSHSSIEDGACAMELTSWIAGEEFSDHPQCACPIISAFMRSWNDNLPDDERGILLPLIPKLVGTRSSEAVEARRATMTADWYVRTFTPAWLRLAGLNDHANALAAFPEITSFEKTPSLRPALEAAQNASSAAESAAESAAWSAAMSAARSAAWSAARSAAESAAWSAARSALESTRLDLQKSALELVDRMIEVREAA